MRKIIEETRTRAFHEPLGWFVFHITDSKYLNATLSEVRNEWTLGDIADAWRRIDFWREIENSKST